MRCVAPSEDLPAFHDHIDITGVELETAAHAAAHFGGDQARARAEKRVIDNLAGPAVVDDRTAHALDRVPLIQRQPQGEVVFDLANGRMHSATLCIDEALQNHQGAESSYRCVSSYTEQYVP